MQNRKTTTTPREPLVIYHADCLDGSAAAAIARLAMPLATCLPWAHGAPPPTPTDVRGRDVYILDFCFGAATMEMIAQEAGRLVLLDHHATAARQMEGVTVPRGTATIDSNHSGAMLAYAYFAEHMTTPAIRACRDVVLHVEDWDLHRRALPGTDFVCAALTCLDADDLAGWAKAMADLAGCMREGPPVLRHMGRQVATLAAGARKALLFGHIVPVANATCYWAAVAAKLAIGYPFAATYRITGGVYTYSLYSHGNTDVSALAEKAGGGGHRNSAGCSSPHALHIYEA